MTTVPEHYVKLHAPAFVINKYLKFCLYTFLFHRQIVLRNGYTSELFEGMLLYLPNDNEIRHFIETVIEDIQECNRGLKTYNVTLYLYQKESFELVERWVFDVNTDFDDITHPLPTRDDLMAKIFEKIDALPTLTESCFFAVMMQQSGES